MWGKLGQMQKTHDTHTALVTMNPKAQISLSKNMMVPTQVNSYIY